MPAREPAKTVREQLELTEQLIASSRKLLAKARERVTLAQRLAQRTPRGSRPAGR
jgi:hypothetical protein